MFELFDVGLYKGTSAPQFEMLDYPSELLACKRYWQFLNIPLLGGWVGAAGANIFYDVRYAVEMRIAPAVSVRTAPFLNNALYSVAPAGTLTPMSTRIDLTITAAGLGYMQNGVFILNSRL